MPEALKMMVALMTSMATGCRYCQGHMANLSHVYDVSDDKIAAIWECETSNLFTDSEKTALVLAREAAGVPNTVEATHFEALRSQFNDAEIVEIVGAIALFGYLNHWNDTMATDMETHPGGVAKSVLPDWDGRKHGNG